MQLPARLTAASFRTAIAALAVVLAVKDYVARRLG
jgi:hypothetical protein